VKIIIGIGGTGIRIAGACVHLLAANAYETDEEVLVLKVDKDTNNGNKTETDGILNAYIAARDAIKTQKQPMFKANLTVLDWTLDKTLGERENQSIDERFHEPNDDRLKDLLFHPHDQTRGLKDGFEQRPTIGALYFEEFKDGLKEDNVLGRMVTVLRNNQDQAVSVYICGSLFGGTGASLCINIAKYIRNYAKENMLPDNRIYIAGALMLPYFAIPTLDDQDLAERKSRGVFALQSQDLLGITRTALDSYDAIGIHTLVRTDQNTADFAQFKVIFDAIYPIGYDPKCDNIPPEKTERFVKGGANQKSNFSLCELLAAQGMCHFFRLADSQKQTAERSAAEKLIPPNQESNVFVVRFGNQAQGQLESIGWENLPDGKDLRNCLLAMMKYALYVTTYLAPRHLQASKKAKAEYLNKLEKVWQKPKEQGKKGSNPDQNINAAENQLQDEFSYCQKYLEFLLQTAKTNNGGNAVICSLFDAQNLQKVYNTIVRVNTSNAPDSEDISKTVDNAFCAAQGGLITAGQELETNAAALSYCADIIDDKLRMCKPKLCQTPGELFARIYSACAETMVEKD
jgi:hypothetical protein